MVRPATRTIAWLALGGSVALLVVGVGLAARRIDERPVGGVATARSELLTRWTTWRTMPVRFDERTQRESGEAQLSATVTIAQRRRDRVVRDGEAVSAVLGGRLIGCAAPIGDRPPVCVDNGASDPIAALTVERERIIAATTSTGGSPAPYRLSDLGGGCFRLRHVVTEPRPEFGDRTEYCFGRSGLLVRETVVSGDLTITTTRRRSGEPTDQDFALPSAVSASPPTTSVPTGNATGG